MRGRMSPAPDPAGRYYEGRMLEERLIHMQQERHRRARIDNMQRRQMARSRLETGGHRHGVARHGSSMSTMDSPRYLHERLGKAEARNYTSPRPGGCSMSPPRHTGGGSISPSRHRGGSNKEYPFVDLGQDRPSAGGGFADRLNRMNSKTEMIEKSGFTTLDIVDGDCVRDELDDEFCRAAGYSPLRRAGYGSLTQNSRANFFENDDDSPLMVSSIDGLSTQVNRPGLNSGPSSLEQDLLVRSDSQFSLMTPSPLALVKTRGDLSPAKQGSIVNLALGTPYSSIRKRIKSVSMKYLKMMPKRIPTHTKSIQDPSDGSTLTVHSEDILRYEDVLRKDLDRMSLEGLDEEDNVDSLEAVRQASREEFILTQNKELRHLEEEPGESGGGLLDTEATVHIEYTPG